MEDKLLTIRQVCERVQVSEPTVRRWIRLGLFPRPIRAGQRLVRFLPDDIEAWLRREDEHLAAATRFDRTGRAAFWRPAEAPVEQPRADESELTDEAEE